jgi:hypothetical protein
VGVFDGSLQLEGTPSAPTVGALDGFVAGLGPGGDVLWRTLLTGAADQRPLSALVLGNGSVLVGGGLRGLSNLAGQDLDAGAAERGFFARYALADGVLIGGALTSLPGDTAVQDMVQLDAGGVLLGQGGQGGLVLLATDATEVWARGFGAPVFAVATHEDGSMFAAGRFSGTLDLDGHVAESAGGLDGFVARVAPETGEVLWLASFGGLGTEGALALAVGCDGRLLVALSSDSPLELAGTALPAGGGLDVVVARLDLTTGEAVSAARFGGDGDQTAYSLVASDGPPLAAGVFEGQLDFGSGPLEAAATSLFAVTAPLAPAGD